MEKDYYGYIKNINELVDEKNIRQAVDSLKTLGKFQLYGNKSWKPYEYSGYTLITPTFYDDIENMDSYRTIINAKKILRCISNPLKIIEAPDSALHMTAARLVSGDYFKENIQDKKENEFLDAVRQFFLKQPALKKLKFEIKGITVFSTGVIAAMISPSCEKDYGYLQDFRDSVYNEKSLKNYGVERKREFQGHVTMFYIERELSAGEKKELGDAVASVNKKIFANPPAFYIKRTEVRRFDNFLGFYRRDNWPLFEFI